MSFLECIDNAEREKEITKEQAAKFRAQYKAAEIENAKVMGADEAAAKASRDAFDSIEQEAVKRKENILKSRAIQQAKLNDIATFKGKANSDGMTFILERDGSGRASYANVEGRRKGYLGRSHAMLAPLITQLKRTAVLGRRTEESKLLGSDILKELFGKSTGNATAKQFAKLWSDAAEFLRLSFNRAGGSIAKRQDWGLPQYHDKISIQKVGRDQWIDYIQNKLDWERIVSEKSGLAIPAAERRGVLADIYDNIVTDGFISVKATAVVGRGKSLARQRTDSRFLTFKDADAWLEYQTKFGGGDVFSIMMNHIDMMSRDIALLEIMGPNPNSTAQFLKTQLERSARIADNEAAQRGEKGGNLAAFKKNSKEFDEMFAMLTGSAMTPVNESAARKWAGLGELLSAAQLGGATVAALLGDTATTRTVQRIAGMPQGQVVADAVKMLVASKLDKQELIAAGMIAENWSSVAYGQSRYIGDVWGPRATQMISHAAMNINLLSPMTQAERWAFQQRSMSHFAKISNIQFSKLDKETKRLFSAYGIDEVDWNAIRSTEKYALRPKWFRGKTEILRPDDVFSKNESAAFKFLEMIQHQTDLAVPVAGIRSRSAVIGGTQPGTIKGALMQSVAQYKSFPLALFFNNLRQLRHLDATVMERAGYASLFAIEATMAGALAVQIKELVAGRQPLEMFDKNGVPNMKFWGKAVLASGALSLFGDFLYSGTNQYGGGLEETILGPRIGFVSDALNLTVGTAAKMINGEKVNLGAGVAKFITNNLPFKSTFYFRIAFERYIADQLQLALDPEAGQKMRRYMRRREREFGNKYWWEIGETAPSRSPFGD